MPYHRLLGNCEILNIKISSSSSPVSVSLALIISINVNISTNVSISMHYCDLSFYDEMTVKSTTHQIALKYAPFKIHVVVSSDNKPCFTYACSAIFRIWHLIPLFCVLKVKWEEHVFSLMHILKYIYQFSTNMVDFVMENPMPIHSWITVSHSIDRRNVSWSMFTHTSN